MKEQKLRNTSFLSFGRLQNLKNGTKIMLIIFILISLIGTLYAHEFGTHSQQLLLVLFGFTSPQELVSEPNHDATSKAYELLSRAIAVAIDETNKKKGGSNSYKELRQYLVGTGVSMPNPESFKIDNWYHRQVCHQGFDYQYNDEKNNARWEIGRKLLVDVASVAFTNGSKKTNPAVAEFVAMISYYTHLIGDLEIGETESLKNIGTYKGLVSELIVKTKNYGNKLRNKAQIDSLVKELENLNLRMPSTNPTGQGEQRTVNSNKIFKVLSQYIPEILSNNVDPIFIFNIKHNALQNVA